MTVACASHDMQKLERLESGWSLSGVNMQKESLDSIEAFHRAQGWLGAAVRFQDLCESGKPDPQERERFRELCKKSGYEEALRSFHARFRTSVAGLLMVGAFIESYDRGYGQSAQRLCVLFGNTSTDVFKVAEVVVPFVSAPNAFGERTPLEMTLSGPLTLMHDVRSHPMEMGMGESRVLCSKMYSDLAGAIPGQPRLLRAK